MNTRSGSILLVLAAVLAFDAGRAAAADPFRETCEKVNQKTVKLFGAGGFQRLNNFGTGVIISPDGHILTVANQLLDTSELIVHLYDGRRMRAEVLVIEPDLDAAIVKIKVEGKEPNEPTGLDLPHFDFAAAAKRPRAEPGDWVLGFTNQFEIALRDEPLTVQHGVIAAYTKLTASQGVFDFPYTGDVYVVDQVMNNPGSPGGALTDREGNLLGIIGRELRNVQTETTINYAIPVSAKIDLQVLVKNKDKEEEKTITLSLPEFVAKGMRGEYQTTKRERPPPGEGGWTGIEFVPNILSRTPAYVEDVVPDSPAAKAGLRPDDLISFVDGEPVVSISAFQEYLRVRTRPGTKIRLEVRRGETLETVEMTLGLQPKRGLPEPTLKKPK